MLAKTDLNQIRKIVREEIGVESKSLKEGLQGEIKLIRIEIQKDIRNLTNRIKGLEIVTNKVEKNIKSIVNFFDKESLRIRKRIERIEEQVNLPPIS